MRVARCAIVLAAVLAVAGCGARVSLGYDEDGTGDGGTSASFDASIPDDAELPFDASSDEVETDAFIEDAADAADVAPSDDASVD